MNAFENMRVEEIMANWRAYEIQTKYQDEIAMEGPTIAGNLVDLKGCLPESSGCRPEVVSGKAHRIRQIKVTHDEFQSNEIVLRVSFKLQIYLTVYERLKKRINENTELHYTHIDIANGMNVSIDSYKKKRALAKDMLIVIDRSMNPHLYKIRVRAHEKRALR